MQPALLSALLAYSKLLIPMTRRSLYSQKKEEASFPTPLSLPLAAPPGSWSQPLPSLFTEEKAHPGSVGSPAFTVIEIWQSRP